MSGSDAVEKAYEAARQRYAELGVDTDKAIERLHKIAISLHCWQGDDVPIVEATSAGAEEKTKPAKHAGLYYISGLVALASLAVCFGISVWVAASRVEMFIPPGWNTLRKPFFMQPRFILSSPLSGLS